MTVSSQFMLGQWQTFMTKFYKGCLWKNTFVNKNKNIIYLTRKMYNYNYEIEM